MSKIVSRYINHEVCQFFFFWYQVFEIWYFMFLVHPILK